MHSRDGMRIGPFARVLGLAVVTAILPGCVVFFREEPVAGPDPDARGFVEVKGVDGTAVVLKDGRSFKISGLDARDLSSFQQKRLQEYIERLVLTRGHGVLVFPDAAKARVVASVPYHRYPLMFEFPALSLFPIKKRVPPTRKDVTEWVLRSGWARFSPSPEMAPELRTRYEQAQNDARKEHRGIWAPPGDQLLAAAACGGKDEVQRLLDLGVDIDHIGKDRKTALLAAVGSAQGETAWFLIGRGADVNYTVGGWSILHAAVYVLSYMPTPARRRTIELLLEAGARPDRADRHGKTPADYARQAKREDIVRLLDKASRE